MVEVSTLVKQGDLYWATPPDPRGPEPGYDRPVVVVQQTAINSSEIRTVVCVSLTTNIRLANVPGNVLLSPQKTTLNKTSIANVSQVITLDKRYLKSYIATLPAEALAAVLDGIELMLGR
jgi:mRNA interferase MazF